MALGVKFLFGSLGALGIVGGAIVGLGMTRETSENNPELNKVEVLSEEEKLELKEIGEESKKGYKDMCDNWGIEGKPKLEFVKKTCEKTKIFR